MQAATAIAEHTTANSAMNITREDIEQLVREPSVTTRMRIVEKIATGYNEGVFQDGELKLANEIFRLLLKDTQVKVRLLLSEQLKTNMRVPHDIILGLANDVTEIALPVLKFSPVLTEEDLILIARATREHPKLRAIAQRNSISKELAHTLIEKHHEDITRDVLVNRNASIAETTLETILDDFARDNAILEELVLRGGLPYTFAEKLFALVSDGMKKELTGKYRMNQHVATTAVTGARETAMLQFISPWMSQQEIIRLVDQMHKNKRLTDSVIVRSLCIGDLRFFETAIAKRVGIPISNARLLLLDPGPLGFKAIYISSGLPKDFYEALRVMLQLAHTETQYGTYRTTDFGARMVERILAGGYHQRVENMSTLLTMIGRGIHENATIH